MFRDKKRVEDCVYVEITSNKRLRVIYSHVQKLFFFSKMDDGEEANIVKESDIV